MNSSIIIYLKWIYDCCCLIHYKWAKLVCLDTSWNIIDNIDDKW